MGSCQSTEKNGILLVVFRNLQLLFCLHFFACTQCRIVVFWLSFLEVRTENLKFRTDLQNQVIDGWSVTHRWLFTKANSSIPCMLLNGILKSWLSPRETLQSHVQVGLSHLRARKQGISLCPTGDIPDIRISRSWYIKGSLSSGKATPAISLLIQGYPWTTRHVTYPRISMYK